jgi:hypothetical protein
MPSSEATHALFCIQKDYKKLEELILAFVEHEIPGGTIMEGRGMGQIICQDLPIFAHLAPLFPESNKDSYVFLCLLPDSMLPLCFELIERVCSPHARGVAFSIELGRYMRLSPDHEEGDPDADQEMTEALSIQTQEGS